MDRCYYFFIKGDISGTRCSKRVTNLDPEFKFCAKHRRCMFPKNKHKEHEEEQEEDTIRFLDYMTFKISCIEYGTPH